MTSFLFKVTLVAISVSLIPIFCPLRRAHLVTHAALKNEATAKSLQILSKSPLAATLLHRVKRQMSHSLVPVDKKPWSVPWPEYKPENLSFKFKDKPWADPEIGDANFEPKFNQLDGQIDRRSHTGVYLIDSNGYPLNPSGRTGLFRRGKLGRWGPNHAADPVVTRWKRHPEDGHVVRDSNTGKPVLQFVAIRRRDNGLWAIPGGMVDPGELVTSTLKREFLEEALNGLELDSSERGRLEEQLDRWMSPEVAEEMFRGMVENDYRNTDNSWMETVVSHFHDEKGTTFGSLNLTAGDDAGDVAWMDLSREMDIFSDHRSFISLIAEKMHCHW